VIEMKKHAIIPLFIPHMGCPHECVFCNQKTITASDTKMDSAKIHEVMESRLLDLEPLGLETLEAAFYGGSFTGLPFEFQQELLGAVLPFKQSGRIQKIRLSTRPDYINSQIMDLLKSYSVDIIELGVQSFDDKVLSLSNRGHTADQTIDACRLVKEKGFSLGIQLMIGLPGDSREKALRSTQKTLEMKPDFVRIYPTVILAGSLLAEMFRCGAYIPLTTEEAVDITKEMVRILNQADIPIIRLGLKSTDNICNDADLARAYHPAFRQLVEGSLAFDDVKLQLKRFDLQGGSVLLSAHPKSFSNLVGHKGNNKRRFTEEYPQINFIYKPDVSLSERQYSITIL
jgi:histone acetyltransferase (RNA polymerase elongator complex component)